MKASNVHRDALSKHLKRAALDPYGRELVVPRDLSVDLRDWPLTLPQVGASRVVFLCLSYKEVGKEPVLVPKAPAYGAVCDANRLVETFDLTVREKQPSSSTPALCSDWLNLRSVVTEHPALTITRTTATWAGPDEVLTVRLTMTARVTLEQLTLTESVIGASVMPGDQVRFTRRLLHAGETCVHCYRLRVTASAGGSVSLSGTVTLAAKTLPAPDSTLAVVAAGSERHSRETFAYAGWLTKHHDYDPGNEPCVVLAAITLEATGSNAFIISAVERQSATLARGLPLLQQIAAGLKTQSLSVPPPQSPPVPMRAPVRATGVVIFLGAQPGRSATSEPIDPELGPGPLAVVLGLEHMPTRPLVLSPTSFTPSFGAPQVHLSAVADEPQSGQFRVALQLQEPYVGALRVRWWAFNKANSDKPAVSVESDMAAVTTPVPATSAGLPGV